MRKVLSFTVMILTVVGLNSALAQKGVTQTSTPENVSIISIDNPTYSLHGEKSVVATLQNNGNTTITSLDLQYSIDNQNPITETISNIEIAPGEVFTHSFSQLWNATPGNYTINVEVLGENNRLVPQNMMEKTIHTASRSVPNLPLFEHFTASTCPPCYSFNSQFTPFLNEHQGEFAIVKYAMNWPGAGDPYYIADGGIRRTYYNVSGVPSLFLGGVPVATSISTITNRLNSELNKEAFFEIDAEAVIDQNNNVTTAITVTPYMNASNLTLHAAVTERHTTGNVGTNGETNFYYVLMKMIPNGQGTTFTAIDGVETKFTLSANLTNTNVEEFDDLMIVVFIQDESNQEILQSFMDDISNIEVGTDLLVEKIDMETLFLAGEQDVSATVKNVGNATITSFDISVQINDGSPFTETVSDVNIPTNSSYTHSFSQPLDVNAGLHSVSVFISDVNGEGDDDNPLNDASYLSISGAANSVNRIPLFEIFTSSTSNPSHDFNVNIFDPFFDEHVNEINVIKFPMNTPGSGDPYYTTEVKTRKDFYNTNTVPSVFVNGVSTPTTLEGITTAYNSQSTKNSFFEINGTAYATDKERIYATVTITSHITTLSPITLHVFVFEHETTGNIGTNGETVFRNTFMKIISGADGKSFFTQLGEETTFDLAGLLNKANVEDLTNLSIVAIIQDNNTKEVLQSSTIKADFKTTGIETTNLADITIYPNPAHNQFNIQSLSNDAIASVEVFDITGKVVYKKQFGGVQNHVVINLSQPRGLYMVKITDESGKIALKKLIMN